MHSTTGTPHHEPMNHASTTGTGTTRLAPPAFHTSRRTRHQQKRDVDHAPQPPNGLRISRTAPIDREGNQAEPTFQKSDDLVDAKRRRAACACSAAA